MTWGPDLSNHNPGADLAAVRRAGASFVFLKATEGVTFTDGLFAGYRRQALAAGLPFGAYHFAHPMPGRNPAAEARHFLQVAGPHVPGNLPPVLDLESTTLGRHDTAVWALTWLRAVAADLGVTPLLYTYPSFMVEYVEALHELARYPLWLASYRPDAPPAPAPWSSWHVWQHTRAARVPGVPGLVDRNVASVSALADLGVHHPPAPAAPKAAPVPHPAPRPAAHPVAKPRPPVLRTKAGAVVLGARVLREGDRGDDVAWLQRFLGIKADGSFGPKTKTAVQAYQVMRGMRGREVDGIVGRNTWAHLLGRR